jgi:hypothetical protein
MKLLHLYLCAMNEKYLNIVTAPLLSPIERVSLTKLALGDLNKTDETFLRKKYMFTSYNP